jgi:hypothetical protein
MKQNIPDNEIVSMFQRYLASNDPNEINKLEVEELAAADARLGLKGINPIFREVIKNKIKDLELKEARKHESRIRAWSLVTGLILGLTIAGIAAWLFTT